MLSDSEFKELIDRPKRTYKDYPNNFKTVQRLKKIVNFMRSKSLYTK